MSTAEVILWGRRIGAVSVEGPDETAVLQYEPDFVQRSGVEVSPLMMPRRTEPYSFPALPRAAFRGLPGMLADSLPDRFGNSLIDAWLAAEGRSPDQFDAVERLCYVGSRGMGALEFKPALGPDASRSDELHIESLVDLARRAEHDRDSFAAQLREGSEEAAMSEILQVGTSAGGARPKAIIAWNPETGEMRSGRVDHDADGFSYWILKFDGVDGQAPTELGKTRGYGAIEYAYHLMALEAGIEMSGCTLLEENGRRHFMTRRFDRVDSGRLHMQSLGAIAHLDFNLAGAHSYEQAALIARRIGIGMHGIEQLFRRAAFNILARNQNDHVKNIAFLMDRDGTWSLAPAFDLTFAYRSSGRWTSQHQMTLNSKRDGFTRADLQSFGEVLSLKRGRADAISDEVSLAVSDWPRHSEEAGIEESAATVIASHHRVLG